jgi:hypothetical protein
MWDWDMGFISQEVVKAAALWFIYQVHLVLGSVWSVDVLLACNIN